MTVKKINHIDDRDLATLRNINKRLYDDKPLVGEERRDQAHLMWLILGRVESFYLPDEKKEHEHG